MVLFFLTLPPHSRFHKKWVLNAQQRLDSKMRYREKKKAMEKVIRLRRGGRDKRAEWTWEGHGYVVLGTTNPLSSIVLFGEVQRSQASETEASALRVKTAYFSVLTLKQVLDLLGALLLERRQLFFNLSGNKMAPFQDGR